VYGFAADFARQTDAHDNPVDYSANYYRLDLSATIQASRRTWVTSRWAATQVGPGASFRTPLATLHAFNGWADKFLDHAQRGLDDLFLGARGKAGAWAWELTYHDFAAEAGSGSFGDEFDASLGRAFLEKFGVLFKAACTTASPTRPTTTPPSCGCS